MVCVVAYLILYFDLLDKSFNQPCGLSQVQWLHNDIVEPSWGLRHQPRQAKPSLNRDGGRYLLPNLLTARIQALPTPPPVPGLPLMLRSTTWFYNVIVEPLNLRNSIEMVERLVK